MLLHTRSLACSTSVLASLFSSTCSSLKVGLSGLRPRPGVPGTLNALFNGELGLSGMVTDSRLLLLLRYPNPMSPGCDSGNASVFPRGSMGEWMLVASANRGVLGPFPSDDVVDVESEDAFRTGSRSRAGGRLLSSVRPIATWVCFVRAVWRRMPPRFGVRRRPVRSRKKTDARLRLLFGEAI